MPVADKVLDWSAAFAEIMLLPAVAAMALLPVVAVTVLPVPPMMALVVMALMTLLEPCSVFTLAAEPRVPSVSALAVVLAFVVAEISCTASPLVAPATVNVVLPSAKVRTEERVPPERVVVVSLTVKPWLSPFASTNCTLACVPLAVMTERLSPEAALWITLLGPVRVLLVLAVKALVAPVTVLVEVPELPMVLVEPEPLPKVLAVPELVAIVALPVDVMAPVAASTWNTSVPATFWTARLLTVATVSTTVVVP